MKIRNRTVTERYLCLPSGALRIPPLEVVTIPAGKEEEVQELLKTPTMQSLMDAKVFSLNDREKAIVPTELPSPQPPASLAPNKKAVTPTPEGKGGTVGLKMLHKSGTAEI